MMEDLFNFFKPFPFNVLGEESDALKQHLFNLFRNRFLANLYNDFMMTQENRTYGNNDRESFIENYKAFWLDKTITIGNSIAEQVWQWRLGQIVCHQTFGK